ncbi:MAG: hypothetical protein ACJ8AE_04015, partial [Gemmatimonadaceae bacterium]
MTASRFAFALFPLAVQLSALFEPSDVLAQDRSHLGDAIQIGAQAIGVVTRESPAIHGRDLAEGYLTQPIIMLHASLWGELLSVKTSIN